MCDGDMRVNMRVNIGCVWVRVCPSHSIVDLRMRQETGGKCEGGRRHVYNNICGVGIGLSSEGGGRGSGSVRGWG